MKLPSAVLTEEEYFKNWIEAIEEPYYPNWFERFTHWLGFHWYYQANKCLICRKRRKSKNENTR